jgi:glycosyltransferase involved in cell wall biosynthesis
MNVVICWTGLSGYAAACWRALAARAGVSLNVICFAPDVSGSDAAFKASTVAGVPCRLLTAAEQYDAGLIENAVAERRPDVVLLTGWAHPPFRSLVKSKRLQSSRFVMAMDTPWRGDWRQTVGGPVIRRYMQRMAAIFVAGERARQYAVQRGIPYGRVYRGMYAYDETLFNEQAYAERLRGGWPRRFLFMGRYVAVKGIDELLAAYAIYKRQHDDPWPLDCCGMGPKQAAIAAAEGVTDLGFIQPEAQPAVLAQRGVLLMPSRYEPWGVVLAEAMASGMPVIASSACGAAVELLQSYYNGLEVPSNDPVQLAGAMSWMHAHHDRLPAMGRHALNVAPAYSASVWAERVEAMCRSLLADTALVE